MINKDSVQKCKENLDLKFTTLKKIARCLNSGLKEQAATEVQNFPPLDPAQNPQDLKIYLFLNALSKRVSDQGIPSKNLYLQNFEANQIDLFNLMGRKMPLVYLSSQIANDLIFNKLKLRKEHLFINVGIGTGRQEILLLEHIARYPSDLKRLHIVGIEPSAESLLQAQHEVEAAGQTCGIDVTFTPINACVEDMTQEQWEKIRNLGRSPIVNAAFALHHSRDKKGVIQKIRELAPELLVLSEPHSDHETPHLAQRFLNAWNHYGLTFDVIDHLNLDLEEKKALKVFFFSREIEDVLGSQEQTRTERHETASQWMARLTKNGFTASNLTSHAPVPRNHPFITVHQEAGAVILGFKQQPIVSIIAVE